MAKFRILREGWHPTTRKRAQLPLPEGFLADLGDDKTFDRFLGGIKADILDGEESDAASLVAKLSTRDNMIYTFEPVEDGAGGAPN